MNKIPFVNIKQGTKSNIRFSHGNTLPLTQLPFAMASFSPQTRVMDGTWFYHPDDRCLEGVRLTHQPSPWLGDYGAIIMQPQAYSDNPQKGWSGYRPEDAILRPDYLKLEFLRSGCTFELSPTKRGGCARLKFEDDSNTYLSFFPVSGNFCAELDEDRGCVIGYTDGHGSDKAENFRMYFVFKFNGEVISKQKTVILEKGISVALNSKDVDFCIGISYISVEQAFINIEQDFCEKGLEFARLQAEKQWEEKLSKIEIETDDEERLRTFYSCLYRVFLYPHIAYEIDNDGNEVHYCPGHGDIRHGKRYTDNGFWDTFRTVYPLLSIIAPDDYAEILDGFVQDYRDFGWLPRWSSIGERGCMPSTLIDAVIADAAVKGIVSTDVMKTAFEGMLHHSTCESSDNRFGRNSVNAYKEYGYVPFDVEKESVNLSLDAAYGDFCIAQTAGVLGEAEIEEEYRERAKNYVNIFDEKTGFMRGRDKNGNMRSDFDPFSWGGEYTEAGAWQTSFFVPHDIEGLAHLLGGTDRLIEKLDKLFSLPPIYKVGDYGSEIHEMSEMAAVDFGQCAISNQPSFHIPFLYAALGYPEKSAYWVKKICSELFSSDTDGFPGDEDNGSMSAWYIFAVLGFYPICPGKAEYINMKEMQVSRAVICGVEWKASENENIVPHSSFFSV